MKKQLKDQGFSLVEIMVSIVILSMVAILLISYFTMAMKQLNTSGEYQETTVAAKSIMEEIKGKTMKEVWNDYMLLNPDLSLAVSKPAYDPSYVAFDKLPVYFLAPVINNATGIKEYDAVISLLPKTDYQKDNSKPIPALKEVTGEKSISIFQEAQDENALFYFWQMHLMAYNQEMDKKPEDRDANCIAVTEDQIEKKLFREIRIDIDPDTDPQKAMIKCQYVYYPVDNSIWGCPSTERYTDAAKTDAKNFDIPVKNDTLNVFLFYRPLPEKESLLDPEKELIQVNWNLPVDMVTLNFYAAGQKDALGNLPELSYKPSVTLGGFAAYVTLNIYSNVDISGLGKKTDWVEQKTVDRLFAFHIDIYRPGAERKPENILAGFDSTKGVWDYE